MDTLELYDLDGTLTTLDPLAAVCGEKRGEEYHYIQAAIDFVAEKTGLDRDYVSRKVIGNILKIYPNRSRREYWGDFGRGEPIMPCTDHFQLTTRAIQMFLQQEDARSEIKTFTESDWVYPQFVYSSAQALPHAHLDEDAVSVLHSRLTAGASPVIVSNSSTSKAATLLERAGFNGHFVEGGVASGKIGVFGEARKFSIDESLPKTPESKLDLRPHGMDVVLDLRRGHFRGLIMKLLQGVRPKLVVSFSDTPELDFYPLAQWVPRENLRVGVKVNPVSSPESIAAVRALLDAATSEKLSALVSELLRE